MIRFRLEKRPFFPTQLLHTLLLINLLLLLLALGWQWQERGQVQVAVAKGQQMLAGNLVAPLSFNPLRVQEILLGQTGWLGTTPQFLNANPLTPGESRFWQDAGCGVQPCAHATLFDYAQGETIEAIVNLQTNQLLSQWRNPNAQPAGSVLALPRALAIAAADSQVRAVLGNIGAANPAMVPMSGWLADDNCREEWCVDLTFQAPDGSGRIFHVFVNMEQETIARTFYTRARPERSAAKPVAQRNAYSDGCHEQYGWSVCWEMTAHDGINFRDASYNDSLIFSSAKIPQVEAWYPSWPGGYRDEIGFNASVPAFGDTQINDLGDGFEVRQLFTEFVHWPNCICCYRYEQVVVFYENGRFDLRFVSHGPGCDDLSVYRPFWRIDLDLGNPANDSVWAWDSGQWVEATRETELHPLVDNISPDGFKLATLDGDLSYRWAFERTDPLGLDEGYLFLLRDNELEGEGPVLPGPGDTYQPPRQWLNGEPLSGGDIVLWHVPLLKTKKSSPWWCMPDPDPDFSPCEAILRAEPAGELVQPSLVVEPTATPLAPPTAVPTPAPTPTPRPIDGTTPEEIILNSGCGACHSIGALGEAGKVGPDLSNIGLLAGNRVAGLSAEAYLRQAIMEPNAFIAPACPNGDCLSNIMPRDYATRLTPAQIDTVVGYLLTLPISPATPVPVIGAEADTPPPAASKAFPAPKRAVALPPRMAPTTIVQLLLVTLVTLLVLLRLVKNPPRRDE
ncbi:MAG: c-type cytochrome [Chloroflexota bacterium]